MVIMKHTLKSIMMGGGLLAFTAVPASAEVEVEITTGYHSIYEWRGQDFGEDMGDAGAELSTELGNGITLTAGAWYQDNSGNSSGPGFNELDLYFELSKSFGKIDVAIGYTNYLFPDSPSAAGLDTHEVYLGLSTELENGIGLSLTYYHDTDAIDAGYLEFEVTKSIEIPNNSNVSIDLSAGAAWSFGFSPNVNGNNRGAVEGFNHFFASVAVPVVITENITLTPYLKYVGADSNFANAKGATVSDDLFYGGVSLSYSF
jgi:hypothetical protein|tara:strand:- start:3982 stop:4758 length:777 start_codon:yes stop_codon:yes gene_type:complete